MRLAGAAQDELWAAVNRGDGAAARRITGPLRLNATAVSPAAAAAAAGLVSSFAVGLASNFAVRREVSMPV
jgi:hypothetical protein